MKNENVLFVAVLLIFATCESCDKDCLADSINGEWIWIKSEGGFTGKTFYPDDFGYTETLVINDYYFKKVINDTLRFQKRYSLEIELDSIFGKRQYILYSGGGKEGIEIIKNQLKMLELDDDGYTRYYKKNRN